MSIAPNTRLGPYEILWPVGSGGMGDVYRARDTRLGRDVAVKVLPEGVGNEGGRAARFEQEARAAGSLNHPNIVAVHDFGQHEGHAYLVTEFLDGEPLRERLKAGPLPRRKAVEYAQKIAEGLAAAHNKGIVHRDLKPENIFITIDGQVKLLDFGLARVPRVAQPPPGVALSQMETQPLETAPGMVLGTVGYMSPEQVRGQAADHRSDIFSFGAVLYEMLTGRQAFRGGSSVETMNAILTAEPPEADGGLPPALDRIVRRCLEKRVEDRFDSARDVAFALSAVASGTSTGAFPAAIRWRRLRIAPASFLIGLILGALPGAFLWKTRMRTEPAPTYRFLTYSGHDSTPAVSPDGKTIAFTSDRDGTPRIWLKQIAGASEVALTDGPDDHPRFSHDGSTLLFTRNEPSGIALYRVPTLGGAPRKIIDRVVNGDFSPDGKTAVFVRWRNEGGREISAVGIVNADGSEAREIAQVEGLRLVSPRVSPDGRRIAVVGSPQGGYRSALVVMRVDGSERRMMQIPGVNLGLSAVAWSGNREVVYAKEESQFGNTSELMKQDIFSDSPAAMFWPYNSLTVDIAGEGALVADTRPARESLRELRTGAAGVETSRWLARGNSRDRQPAYSPDGGRVLFCSNRGGSNDIWQIVLDTGALTRLTEDPADDIDPAFSPDGQQFVWSSARHGHFEIYIASADGSNTRRVTNDGLDAENATMTRDGRWIVYASNHPEKAGIWRIRPNGSGAARLAAGPHFNPEVSPDGRHALYVTSVRPDLNVIRVVGVEPASAVAFEIRCEVGRQSGVLVGRARWMPDGRAIAFVGQDERGVHGVFVQDFIPGKDTAVTRRRLAAFDPDSNTSTFGLSPDGRRLIVSSWEQNAGIVLAERLPLIGRPGR